MRPVWRSSTNAISQKVTTTPVRPSHRTGSPRSTSSRSRLSCGECAACGGAKATSAVPRPFLPTVKRKREREREEEMRREILTRFVAPHTTLPSLLLSLASFVCFRMQWRESNPSHPISQHAKAYAFQGQLGSPSAPERG